MPTSSSRSRASTASKDWADLAHHVETIDPSGVRKFEQMAEELAAAYSSAGFEAVREINWTYGTSFVGHRESEAMHRQLPTWFASESRPMDLAVADARTLVARKRGFDTWDELVRRVSGARATSHGGLPFALATILNPVAGGRIYPRAR